MSLPSDVGTQPIIIDPYDVYLASQVFAAGQDQLEGITSGLSDALAGCAGMAGNDGNGQAFGHKCDPAAAALVRTLCASIPVLGQMAQCLVVTANNYLKAEHHSTAGASALAPEYPLPGLTMAVTMPPPPSAIGDRRRQQRAAGVPRQVLAERPPGPAAQSSRRVQRGGRPDPGPRRSAASGGGERHRQQLGHGP